MPRFLFVLWLLVGCGAGVSEQPEIMTTNEALAMSQPAPDQRVDYGPNSLSFAEIRLPQGPGPHPVVIVIHGGCWLAEYDLAYVSGLASRLTDSGFATWSIEYRRVGDLGGGWPGTFSDVAAAADHLRVVAPEMGLDLDRVVALGHSAGGHLALWLAARHGLPEDDPLRGERPLPLRGVVALAGIPDLATYSAPSGCGAAVTELLGGDPDDVPERLRRSSPSHMVPLGVPQVLITGRLDPIVPLQHAEAYEAVAAGAGDAVSVRVVEDAGHFELVNPDHDAYEVVETAVKDVMGEG